VFKGLDCAGDVIIVCESALENQNTDCDKDVVTTLRRYVSNARFK